MRITVHLFGPQATLAGARSVAIELATGSPTVGDALAAIGDAAPTLRGSLATSRLAINHEFATTEQIVHPGDEVALIGMVSGG